MKKILKKEVIIAFIVGIILASSIAVYAAAINAKDVDYTKPGTTTAISVETALNDLYSNYGKFVKSGINQNSGITIQVEKGSYIAISSVDQVAQITNCETIVNNSLGGVAAGVGSWSSVYKATDTTVQVTINNSNKFTYYVFK